MENKVDSFFNFCLNGREMTVADLAGTFSKQRSHL